MSSKMSVLATVAVAAGAALFAGATTASADTVSFSGSSSASYTKSFTSGTTTVTASAYESTFFDPGDNWFADQKKVTQTSAGLGVNGSGILWVDDPSGEVDGFGINEFLRLDFSTTVDLVSALITNVDVWGHDAGSDGVRVFNQAGAYQDFFPLEQNPSLIAFEQPFRGTSFLFTALGSTVLAEKADFSLGAITFEKAVSGNDVQTVPLPTAGWGGLALLGAAGAVRFRRARRNADDSL
jgi:hypothetical protein